MRVLVLFTMLLITVAASLHAQTEDTLAMGTVVRIRESRMMYTGRLMKPLVSGDSAVNYCRFPAPCAGSNAYQVPLNELMGIETVAGTRAVRGAVIGGLVGATFMFLSYQVFCGNEPCGSQFARQMRFTLVGAALGVIPGVFIGSGTRRWEAWPGLGSIHHRQDGNHVTTQSSSCWMLPRR